MLTFKQAQRQLCTKEKHPKVTRIIKRFMNMKNNTAHKLHKITSKQSGAVFVDSV